jgi:hypothetical protein
MATQVTVPDFDTVLDVIGVVVVYLGWIIAGGPPIPILAEFVPFIAAGAAVIVGWRYFRKNNRTA